MTASRFPGFLLPSISLSFRVLCSSSCARSFVHTFLPPLIALMLERESVRTYTHLCMHSLPLSLRAKEFVCG